MTRNWLIAAADARSAVAGALAVAPVATATAAAHGETYSLVSYVDGSRWGVLQLRR